jgi:hypothetical protein
MAGNADFDTILATTLKNYVPRLVDNVFTARVLVFFLKQAGNIRQVGGGAKIVLPLIYAQNDTAGSYSGYDPIDTTPQEGISAAEYSWKQYAASIAINGLEEAQNAGEEQIIDLLEARMDNAEKSLMNTIAADCYSDGTANGSKVIGGLQYLVPDSVSSGTVGGIDQGTYTWWRSVVRDASSTLGAVTSANIKPHLNALHVQLVRGSDKPDLYIADDNYWTAYLESLQAIQQVTSDSSASAGFSSLKYMGADFVLDGGFGGGCPENHCYALNTNYIFLRPHAARNFVPLGKGRESVNQDATVKLMAWAGNMTASVRFLQGVLKA